MKHNDVKHGVEKTNKSASNICIGTFPFRRLNDSEEPMPYGVIIPSLFREYINQHELLLCYEPNMLYDRCGNGQESVDLLWHAREMGFDKLIVGRYYEHQDHAVHLLLGSARFIDVPTRKFEFRQSFVIGITETFPQEFSRFAGNVGHICNGLWSERVTVPIS